MRRTASLVLALLIMTFAATARTVGCGCGDLFVEDASKASASIFIGEVVDVSDPYNMLIGSNTEQVYLTKFLVWERWKGAKSIEAAVLIDLPGHLPQMSVGEVYLVYANPLALQGGSAKVEGIVTPCSRTSLIERPGLQQKVLNPRPFFDIFKLDKIFGPAAQRTPVFRRHEEAKSFCLVCCF
jgi:hypothetical protein